MSTEKSNYGFTIFLMVLCAPVFLIPPEMLEDTFKGILQTILYICIGILIIKWLLNNGTQRSAGGFIWRKGLGNDHINVDGFLTGEACRATRKQKKIKQCNSSGKL